MRPRVLVFISDIFQQPKIVLGAQYMPDMYLSYERPPLALDFPYVSKVLLKAE